MNSNGANGYTPPDSLRHATFVFKELGFSGVMVILVFVLIGMLTGKISSPSLENQQILKVLSESFAAHSSDTQRFRGMFINEINYQNQLLRRICKQGETTEIGRRECERERIVGEEKQ